MQSKPSSALLSLLAAAALVAACDRVDEEARPVTLYDAPAPGVSDAAALPPIELAVPEDVPTVVFIGDSIGAGLHLPEHQAFPSVLQRRLAKLGETFELVNASESGRTTAGGLTALDWVMRREPDLVVIELGGNDGLRGIDLETVENNLRAMIERARESGAAVLLLGVRMPTNLGDYAGDFDAIYPQLAEEYGVALAPYFMEGVGAVPEMNQADGLHPTAEGHERLAENVLPALRTALGRLAD